MPLPNSVSLGNFHNFLKPVFSPIAGFSKLFGEGTDNNYRLCWATQPLVQVKDNMQTKGPVQLQHNLIDGNRLPADFGRTDLTHWAVIC